MGLSDSSIGEEADLGGGDRDISGRTIGVRAVQKVVQDSCHLFVALGQQELLEVWPVEEPAQIHLIRLHVGKAIKLYLHYFENIQSIRLGA